MSAVFHDPGQMNHRVTLQALVETADDLGSLTDGFEPVATVWAALRPVRRDERLVAQQIEERADHAITIRFRDDVATGWRIALGERHFEIVAVTDPDERRRYLVLHTQEAGR